MRKRQIRTLNLILYGCAVIVSLVALYTFVFVFNQGTGWKIFLIIVGIGWLLSAISGFIRNWDSKNKGKL